MAQPEKQEDVKMQTYLRGGLVGLLVGLVAAHLYSRAADETGNSPSTARIGSNDLIKVSLAILALVRQITELGGSKK